MQLRIFRVWLSVTEGLFKDIKASYADTSNGILTLTVLKDKPNNTPGKDYLNAGAFIDWQFYEVLDD